MKITRQHSAAPASSAITSDARSVLDSVRRVVRVLRLGSRSAEKQVGLSSAQLFVLQKLAEERSLSVNEVAERTHTHQSSVSVVVQRLADRGLASRVRSQEDGRQMRLSVTTAGRAALRSAPTAAQDQLIDALARMTPRHLRQLATTLRKLVDLLGVDNDEPAVMLFEDEADPPKRPRSAGNQKSQPRMSKRGS